MNYRFIIYSLITLYLLYKAFQPTSGTIPIQESSSIKPIPTVNLTPEPDPMPISEYQRPYEMEKIGYIWRAKNGSSYIDPDHEVVQWFSRHTEIRDKILYYKDTDKKVVPNYYPDFSYPNEDYWMNADYYLSHGLQGDCEDYAIAIASILEAKGISNMIVLGWHGSKYNGKHAILEYYYDGKYYTTDTTYGLYIPKEKLEQANWSPQIMFNKNTDYTFYKSNWFI